MRLINSNPSLLDKRLDKDIMPEALEGFWHDKILPIAKRLYVAVGVTNRMPFVIDEDTSPPEIHHQSSLILRKMTEKVPGRTTMISYSQHALRLLITMAEDGQSVETVSHDYLSQYRKRRLASETKPGETLSFISWNSEAAAIKTMFSAAMLAGLRNDNPVEHPVLQWKIKGAAAAPSEPKFVTLERFRKFRDDGLMQTRSPLRNAAFAEFLLTSGMRLYECSQIPRGKIALTSDATAGRACTYAVPAIHGKGWRARKVPIGIHAFRRHQAYERLERQPKLEKVGLVGNTTALWINQSGQLMSIQGWEMVFQAASAKSGIKITPHTLRHTFAVYMLCALLRKHHESAKISDQARRLTEGDRGDAYQTIFGDPLRSLQRLLGHSSYETTLIYLDVLSADDFVIDEALQIFQETLGSEEDYRDLIR